MHAILALILLAAAAADPDSSQTPNDKERLQGLWKAVSLHANGESAPAEIVQQFTIKIDGDKLVFNPDTENRVHTFSIVSDTDPRTLDLIPADGPARDTTLPAAIYKLDDDKLVLCIWKEGRNGETTTVRPREFKETTAGDGLALIKLERVTNAD